VISITDFQYFNGVSISDCDNTTAFSFINNRPGTGQVVALPELSPIPDQCSKRVIQVYEKAR
jgi:hypothetical protein